MQQRLTYYLSGGNKLRSLCVLFCMLLSFTASAQQKNIEQPKDTTQLIKGVQMTYNIAGTILRMFNSYGEYEASAKLNLKDKYFPTVEVGYGTSEHETDPVTGLHVKSNAPYFRLGFDYNIAKNKHDKYRIFVGCRYGFTKFDFESDAIVTDPVWGGESQYTIKETGLTYHWAEILFGVSARFWGPLYMGWTFRYKTRITSNEGSSGNLWYIPGFGEQGNKIGATFNIGVEI